MMPKRILLIRHAQSEANENPEVYANTPDHLHELTIKGISQAKKTGQRIAGIIGDDGYGVFVSPYTRTIKTMEHACEQLAKSPTFLHQDPRLREQDYGPMRAQIEADHHRAEREKHGRFFYRFPGGESCADIFDRVSTFLETLHRRFQSEDFPSNIIIFTHGTAMACFLMRWYHWSYQRFEAMPLHPPNGHIVLMDLLPDQASYAALEPFEPCLLHEAAS